MDKPDLVSDFDALTCARAGWFGMVAGIDLYRMLFSLHLGRPISAPEAYQIISKVNGLGPLEYGDSILDIERTETAVWVGSKP